jgi:REP element-mobilizing transposase RayT
MPYVKNWLHCVWGTKNRVHFLTSENKFDIITHIRSNAVTKGIYIDFLNGNSEHLHCLMLLRCDHTLAFVMQMIKGESSHWINKNKLTKVKFEWADEYYAASVSESHVVRVREYIKNQDVHHRIKSWDEENTKLVEQWGFSKHKC